MTRKTTARTAHLPRAIAPSATGASTSAVAARHLSIWRPLDAAPPPGTGGEGFNGAQELLRREVRPQSIGHVKLGVGYLPEQEVGDAQLAAGPDYEIHLGYLGRVEVAGEGSLVDILGGEAVRDYAPRRVHDLRAAAVVESHVDIELVVVGGELLRLPHGLQDRSGEVLAASEEPQASAALVQVGHVVRGDLEKERHQGVHLVLRASPVLGREGVEGERLYADPAGGLEQRGEDLDAGAVARGARKAAALGPAPVAVHDHGDVARGAAFFHACEDARLGRRFGGMFSDWFQRLDLQKLHFFVAERSVYALHVVVSELLQLFFGPALLGHAPSQPDELAPALLGELRDGKADYLAVVLWVEAYVGVPYTALDVLEGVRVERRDGEQPRLRRADVSDAPQGHARPVDLDLDTIEQRRVGPAGAYCSE